MEELQRELEAPTFGPPSSMAAPGNSSWKSRSSTEGVFHVHLIILILKIQMIYDVYICQSMKLRNYGPPWATPLFGF